MTKYMCAHTIGPNALSKQQVEQMADALQHDQNLHGYRSFANLSEGKVFCIIEAQDQRSVASWFQKNKVPVDWICPVELEGDRGDIRDAREQMMGTGEYGQTGTAASGI